MKRLEFKPEQFMSDRQIDKSIRQIFPEWKEILGVLVTEYAKHAQKLFDDWFEKQQQLDILTKVLSGEAMEGECLTCVSLKQDKDKDATYEFKVLKERKDSGD